MPVPNLATEPLLKHWDQEVCGLPLAKGKITDNVVRNIPGAFEEDPRATG